MALDPQGCEVEAVAEGCRRMAARRTRLGFLGSRQRIIEQALRIGWPDDFRAVRRRWFGTGGRSAARANWQMEHGGDYSAVHPLKLLSPMRMCACHARHYGGEVKYLTGSRRVRGRMFSRRGASRVQSENAIAGAARTIFGRQGPPVWERAAFFFTLDRIVEPAWACTRDRLRAPRCRDELLSRRNVYNGYTTSVHQS